jgi:Domain of unknown function (DUF4177)
VSRQRVQLRPRIGCPHSQAGGVLEAWQKNPGMRAQQPYGSRRFWSIIRLEANKEKGIPMDTSYQYKFVRLGDYRGSAWFGVSDKVRSAYEDVVHEHARDGWRLVQIFAPGVAAFGAAKYYELIFERERAKDLTASTSTSRERVGSPAGA